MPTFRNVRMLSLFALLLAAILSPALHLRSTDRPVNYTVAFHVGHPSNQTRSNYQLVTSSESVTKCSIAPPPIVFVRASNAEPIHPSGEVTAPAASASPDRLARFQLPPPPLQA